MESRVLILVATDACLSHMVYYSLLQMVAIRKWIKRRHMFYEYKVRLIILRTAVFDVVNDSPADSIRERKRKRLARDLSRKLEERHDRAGDVRTAPGKCLDASIRHGSVKARDHGVIDIFKIFTKRLMRLFRLEFSVLIKTDHFGCVNVAETKAGGQHHPVEILAPGSRVIAPCLTAEHILDHSKLFPEINVDVKTVNDFLIPRTDCADPVRDIFAPGRRIIGTVQHIRNLGIIREAFSRRRRDNIAARRIRADNIAHLFHLCSAGQR